MPSLPADGQTRRVRRTSPGPGRNGWWSLVRAHDVAVGYAVLVVLTTLLIFRLPDTRSAAVVLGASTNLVNLRSQPLRVLLASAFVVSTPWSLWVLPVLVVTYGAAQRWVGRAATVLVALLGHVFATLLVGVLLAAGIARRQLDHRLAHEPDVGVSYGLATLLGLLVFRLPPRLRRRVVAGVTAVLVLSLVLDETFTDLGHLVAWGTGLGVGLVGQRMAAAVAGTASQPSSGGTRAGGPWTGGTCTGARSPSRTVVAASTPPTASSAAMRWAAVRKPGAKRAGSS